MTQRVRAHSWFASAITGALAASAIVFAPGLAAAAEEPRTFALVGSLQSELGCTDLGANAGGDWEPACAATDLAATDTPGVYAADFTIPAGTYEYKVAVNDSWAESYGLNGGGDNIPLTVAGDTPVRVVFDDTLKRVGLEATGLRGAYDEASDAALVADPVRQPGSDEVFYFVMTDRFENGDTSNDQRRAHGRRPHHRLRPRPTRASTTAATSPACDRSSTTSTDSARRRSGSTPSFKNRPVQGEGANASAGYHGYWVTDFTQIDPHLGTNAELEALIGEAHAKGIKVYFDIITNHTADVIDYEEGQYSYIDQATAPYRDADGNEIDLAEYAGGRSRRRSRRSTRRRASRTRRR